MPINSRLLQFLTRCGARYTVYPHDEAFAALRRAETHAHHMPELARAVAWLDPDGACVLAVMPASAEPIADRISELAGYTGARAASPAELRARFPDCEVGTMPPFGHLYGCATLMDPCLLEADRIYFQAGNRREVVGMWRDDFDHLALPQRARTCLHEEFAHAAV